MHGIEVVYQNLYILRSVVYSVHDLVPANLLYQIFTTDSHH